MTEDFATYIDGERARLTQKRADLGQEFNRLVLALTEVDREFEAINAYEAAKTGKTQPVRNGAAPRARRGGRREAILNAISNAPAGMARGDLIEMLGVKGNKGAEMSISNALTALIKSGQLYREGRVYHCVAAPLAEAAE